MIQACPATSTYRALWSVSVRRFPPPRAPSAPARSSACRPVSALHRTDRRQQGVRGALDLFMDWRRVRYLTLRQREIDLVLIGTPVLEIPPPSPHQAPGFRHRCRQVRRDGRRRRPRHAVVLSRASRWWRWKPGRWATPVLANGRCDVLLGQCIRSNAGLYYQNEPRVRGRRSRRFSTRPRPRGRCSAESGRRFYDATTLAGRRRKVPRPCFNRLARPSRHPRTDEPLPGLIERRRRRCRRRPRCWTTARLDRLVHAPEPLREATIVRARVRHAALRRGYLERSRARLPAAGRTAL